jgi:hypothetical protein
MIKIAKLLIGWLWGRQPRVVDYIFIAVIATIFATAIIAATSSGGQNAKPTLSGPASATSSVPTAPVTTALAQKVPSPHQTSTSATSASRSFYAPNGNVSCSLQSESAQCSVASAGLTFVIPKDGGGAYTTPGLSVPLGAGSEAPFGSEQSDGVIVCDIPPEDLSAGVTCRDTISGHGFEASRVASRQSVY